MEAHDAVANLSVVGEHGAGTKIALGEVQQLVEQVEATGIEVPDELASVEWLTPWAAALRYDEPTPLDRPSALAAAESAISWATGLVSA